MSKTILTEEPFDAHFTIKKPKAKITKGKQKGSQELEKALEENKRLSEKNARMKKIINAIYGNMGSILIGEEAPT